MIRSEQILNTVSMIQKENLDVRAVTLGINLLDCRASDIQGTCARVRSKIHHHAARLVATCDAWGGGRPGGWDSRSWGARGTGSPAWRASSGG